MGYRDHWKGFFCNSKRSESRKLPHVSREPFMSDDGSFSK